MVVWLFWELWEVELQELMLNGTSGQRRDLLATSSKVFFFNKVKENHSWGRNAIVAHIMEVHSVLH